MKKLLVFAAYVILALSLAACNSAQTSLGDYFRSSVSTEDNTSSIGESSQPEPSSSPASSEHGEQQGSSLSAEGDSFSQPSVPAPSQSASIDEEEAAQIKWNIQVGGQTFTATPENNAAVEALTDRMREAPMVIQMSDYSGFEKVGPLGAGLPTENSQTTAQAGDIVLFQGDQIVIFYGSNSWSYTRLGKINDLTGWEEALGSGDVTVTFSMKG